MKKNILITIIIITFFLGCLKASADDKKDKAHNTKKNGVTQTYHITREKLQSLPCARNPWSIFGLVPGMLLDREDVGGYHSGQQSSFFGFGVANSETNWTVNGAYLTDQAALGAAPAYFNTNSYDEIQVTTGFQDIDTPNGGITLNFISRRGGNDFAGDIYIYAENEAWQMNRAVPASISMNNWGSPGIIRLYQYGANFGGPVLRDKLWFHAAYGIQDIYTRTITQENNQSWLAGGYVRLDFNFGTTSGSLQFGQDDKNKWNRYWSSAANQAPETTWTQKGPHRLGQLRLQQQAGHLLLNAAIDYQDGGFSLDPLANRLNNNYMLEHQPGPDWFVFFFPITYWTGSCQYFASDRDSVSLSLDANYSAGEIFGGDHEIRFGVQYFTGTTTSQSIYPNQRRLVVYQRGIPSSFKYIEWLPDCIYDVTSQRISFYLADTFSLGNLTIFAGCRYDKQTGRHNPVIFPGLTFNGIPIFTDYLGEISIPGQDIAAAFEVVSPRLALTYDFSGSGRDVLKTSFARYGSNCGNTLASYAWPYWSREIDVEWQDTNGNLVLDWGEWSEDFAGWLGWVGFDVSNPYQIPPRDLFDPDYNSPLLSEVTLGYEKSLGQDFSISLTAIYKKLTHLTWDRGYFTSDRTDGSVTYQAGDLETADNWYMAGTYVFADGTSKPYYSRYYAPDLYYRTNYGSGTYRTYKALELVLSKKFSAGWMLDASFVYADWKSYYDEAESFDKTNYDYLNGGAYGTLITFDEASGMYANSRWQVRVSGLFQLPFGFALSGIFRAREGYIIPYHEYLLRGSGIGWSNIYQPGKKMGDDRLPALWVLDLGLEKTFRVGPGLDVTLLLNVYNMTNNNTTLKVESLLSSPFKGQPLHLLNPGIGQFGIRVTF